jgi:hypothetical protein
MQFDGKKPDKITRGACACNDDRVIFENPLNWTTRSFKFPITNQGFAPRLSLRPRRRNGYLPVVTIGRDGSEAHLTAPQIRQVLLGGTTLEIYFEVHGSEVRG